MRHQRDHCLTPLPRLSAAQSLRTNPIDVLQRLAVAEQYECERVDKNEIHLTLPGLWCEHDVSVLWKPKAEQLDLFLMFDGRAPGGRSQEICRLLTLLNERLSAGHFEFWGQDCALVFRNSMSLAGGANMTIEQAMALIERAIDAAERGYPASQYVLWAGKTPEEALTAALLDLVALG